MPGWGEERISNMIATRPDWCISRQRTWGVPIVVFYCDKCREPLTERKILDGVVDLIRQHNADIWYQRTAAELIPAGTTCGKCGSAEFTKENDILDVWFDSGSSHLAVLTEKNDLAWPSSLYIEGGDQYRGWFHSSLLVGLPTGSSAPCRPNAPLTAGRSTAKDAPCPSRSATSSRPKTLSRSTAPTCCASGPHRYLSMKTCACPRPSWNGQVRAVMAAEHLPLHHLGNLHGFDPIKIHVPAVAVRNRPVDPDQSEQSPVPASGTTIRIYKVYRAVYDVSTIQLSNVYFDILKDRLYTSATKSPARRAAQTALYRLAHTLVRLLAPILTFTCEEVWPHLGETGSVHTALFPEPSELTHGLHEHHRKQAENWDRLMEFRPEVLNALEAARQAKFIGAPLEARVRIAAGGDLLPLLQRYSSELPGLFIVSEVVLEPGEGITVERAPGTKCERCWKYTQDVGSDSELRGVCAACASAIRQNLALETV